MQVAAKEQPAAVLMAPPSGVRVEVRGLEGLSRLDPREGARVAELLQEIRSELSLAEPGSNSAFGVA